jgi:Flp pilus assembly pilin Flp
MRPESRRERAARSARRLWSDERGIGAVELVVLLVLVMALAVSFWNLFGNDVASRLSDAVVSFDDSTRPAATQRVGAAPTGSGSASAHSAAGGKFGGGRSGAGGAGSSYPAVTPSRPAGVPPAASSSSPPAVPANAGAAQPAVATATPSQASSSSSPASAATEPTLGQQIETGLATIGEHVVDLTEGAIAGANPMTPLVPVELKPTFGHQVTYGVGEVAGSVIGLLDDAGNIVAGGTGVVASGAVIVASDGTLIPAALPAMAASGTLAAAGVAGAAGHGTNLMQGIDDIVHGDNSPARPTEPSQGGAASADKPPAKTDTPAARDKAPADHGPGGEKPASSHEAAPSREGSAKDPGGGDSASPGPGKAGSTAPRKVGGFTPKQASELGVTVRPDGKEVYYRAMSQKDYDALKSGRGMPGTGETSTSPTRGFSENYDGVLVEFEMKPGTTAKLQEVGVSDGSPLTREKLPEMPTAKEAGGKWNEQYARFKEERKQINVQLGRGRGLEVFNENIGSFREIPR